ncbi:sad1-interacting factor 2 [Methyloprofundus sedimenti]|uniref:Sad1-interacting factor 2 n=1 Tax=Methyloprofundus sedimenti TaxID=1420851 RepID=A0A1V8M7A2_9GAMM|nr:RMD1 family protein [Methyloprofundus sedimenti]OQK17425.1 sad1-interacting factor 2 [Methyloprofundus sedimenti]
MTDKTLHCITLCLANSFDFPTLCKNFLANNRAVLLKDVLLIEHNQAYSVIFPYGVVVHWNVTLDERRKLHTQLCRFAIGIHEEIQEDDFRYITNALENRIKFDCIEIKAGDDTNNLIAVAHAMAQSINLSSFEQHAQETIEKTKHLPESLAKTGHINLSKKALAKIRGQLFLTNSDIVLKFDLLDIPEFFWEHPEYQALYMQMANYLELQQRTDILSKKLDTIHDLLGMLADEQKHQHSSTLEWIIIVLIMVEIVITLVEKLM